MIGFRLCPAGGNFSLMFAVLSVLRHMRDLNFKKACWISNFIFTDGTRSAVCAGEAAVSATSAVYVWPARRGLSWIWRLTQSRSA